MPKKMAATLVAAISRFSFLCFTRMNPRKQDSLTPSADPRHHHHGRLRDHRARRHNDDVVRRLRPHRRPPAPPPRRPARPPPPPPPGRPPRPPRSPPRSPSVLGAGAGAESTRLKLGSSPSSKSAPPSRGRPVPATG